MLLARNGILDVRYTSENIFKQVLGEVSLINQRKKVVDSPICHPKPELFEKSRIEADDAHLLRRINMSSMQELTSIETRRMVDIASPVDAEIRRKFILASLCESGKKQFCIEATNKESDVAAIDQFCEVLGGGDERHSADPASIAFLSALDEANLDGVVVWGLRPDTRHTHKYIHMAIHKAVAAALVFSSTPRHLCYVNENPAFDLGRDLYQNESRGRLARSLVVAAPKHMTWTKDPGFLMLPCEATSRYIFHGETPRPHTALKRHGLAVEWEAWGPGESNVQCRGLHVRLSVFDYRWAYSPNRFRLFSARRPARTLPTLSGRLHQQVYGVSRRTIDRSALGIKRSHGGSP